MTSPYCQSNATCRRKRATALGYKTFFCKSCQHLFNERTGTPFNELQFPHRYPPDGPPLAPALQARLPRCS
jgi:transposase-like protein